MKKAIIVLIIILLSGCYDYDELTDLGIVSSMIIDYDEEYTVNLEILETSAKTDNTSYFIEGKGETFEFALQNAYTKSTKHIYLNHLYSLILNKDVLNNHLKEIYDFFLIDADVKKDTFFVFCDNTAELKEYKSEDGLSLGETIKNIIHYNERENGNFKSFKFSEILHARLNSNNYIIGGIDVNDDVLSLQGSYIIENDKPKLLLEEEVILFINILKNQKTEFLIFTKSGTFEIYNYTLKENIEKDLITITFNADARFFGYIKNANFKISDLSNIEKEISKNLNQYFANCINYSIDNSTDIYNFDYFYYLHYPKKSYKGIYKEIKYDIKTDVKLNEKGLLLNDIGVLKK